MWDDRLLRWLGYRERVSTANSLASAIGRWHLNGNVFGSDPDVFILRNKGNRLSPDQRYTLFLLNHVFGTLVFTSDNIDTYSEQELEIYLSQFPVVEKSIRHVERSGDVCHVEFTIDNRQYEAFANLGAREESAKPGPGVYFGRGRFIKAVLANRTNLLGFVQGIPGSIPWGLIPFFLIPFYEGKGFTKEFATMLTLVLGLGATAGGLLGGWTGDRIFRRSPRALPLFCAGAVLAGVAPGYMIMTMHLTPAMGSHAMAMPLVASFLTGVIVTIPSANIKAMLINVNPPERRGSVFGLHNITDSLGRGIGPFLGGMLIRSHGYLYAMLFAVFMWIPCAVLYGAMALTIDGDLSSLGRYLREKRDKIVGAGVSL